MGKFVQPSDSFTDEELLAVDYAGGLEGLRSFSNDLQLLLRVGPLLDKAGKASTLLRGMQATLSGLDLGIAERANSLRELEGKLRRVGEEYAARQQSLEVEIQQPLGELRASVATEMEELEHGLDTARLAHQAAVDALSVKLEAAEVSFANRKSVLEGQLAGLTEEIRRKQERLDAVDGQLAGLVKAAQDALRRKVA